MPGLFDSGGGPDFSLAGMILGGRGYAANWFGQRDQMLWAQAAQARQDAAEKQFGADLMNNPLYQKFRDNPQDRAAALDFFVGTRGAPGDIDTQLGSYIGTGLTAQYNKAQSELQAQQQRENTAYAHELDLKETDYRSQKELELYKSKAEYDDARKAATLKTLEGMPGEIGLNMRFRTVFGNDALPADKSISQDPVTGALTMRPATGSTEHIKMISQLTAGETLVDQLTQMSTQLERGDYTTAGWNATQASLLVTAKSLFESGALDEGSLNVLSQMLPKMEKLPDPGFAARTQEQLRATIIQLKIRNQAVIDNYSTPLRDLPAGRGDQKYFPEPRGEPPAEGRVKAAQKAIESQPAVTPKSYGKQYDPTAPGGVFQ